MKTEEISCIVFNWLMFSGLKFNSPTSAEIIPIEETPINAEINTISTNKNSFVDSDLFL